MTATEQAAPAGVPARALRHIPEFLLGIGALVLRAALGVAGAVAQGITRNPPASPSTLGINAGAGFGVVVATFAPHPNSPAEYVRFAFAGPTGAAGAAVPAQAPARRSGDVGPIRLALGEATGMGLPSK